LVVRGGSGPVHGVVGVADPLLPNPMASGHTYEVKMSRLIHSIMLGTLTFDANILIIAPKGTEV
jgi:hypothetical protein